MLSKISIIGFDLDDTLWPCMPVIAQAEKTLYAWLAENYPKITERYNAEKMVEQRKLFTAENPRYQVDLSLMRHEFLRFLADQDGYHPGRVAGDGFQVFLEARQQVEFYDDVMPCLHRLGEKFRLGAISNGNANVDRVGLGHLFEHSISAGDARVAKPDVRIFEHFAERFDVPHEQILYVGDHPVYDVVGPVEAGFKAVWINREGAQWPSELPEPTYEITDLHQLEALFNAPE